MSNKKIAVYFIVGILTGAFIISPLLNLLGIPGYGDLLNYLFGDVDEVGIWNGVIFPIFLTVGLVLVISVAVVKVAKKRN